MTSIGSDLSMGSALEW